MRYKIVLCAVLAIGQQSMVIADENKLTLSVRIGATVVDNDTVSNDFAR